MNPEHDIIDAGQDLERRLGCRLFPDLDLERLRCLSIGELRRCYRGEIESILSLRRMLDEGANVRDMAAVVRTIGIHGRERPGSHRDILGYDIKAICSNVRRQDVDWNRYGIREAGIGTEGDIVIAQALSDTGSTNHVEDQGGREARLFRGDDFMAVLGHRHSGTSEYGGLPGDGTILCGLDERADLLCHGGIIGKGICIPSNKQVKTFFETRVVGLVQHEDRNLNLLDLYPAWDRELLPSAPIIFNCGTSAEIGKTTSSSSVIRALKRKGLRVGAAKLAGTGRYRDLLSMRDAGADAYYDFPDVGLPSTYTSAGRAYAATVTLLNRLNREGMDIIVAEMGGDIVEANIPVILQSPEIMRHAAGIVHSSADVLGILGSLRRYREFGVQVPVQLTFPKDRNNAGTVERLQQEQLEGFDVMDETACDRVVDDIVRRIH